MKSKIIGIRNDYLQCFNFFFMFANALGEIISHFVVVIRIRLFVLPEIFEAFLVFRNKSRQTAKLIRDSFPFRGVRENIGQLPTLPVEAISGDKE